MKSTSLPTIARALPFLALAAPLFGCADLASDAVVEDPDALYNANDNGLGTMNGLSTTNGLGTMNGLSTTNGLSGVNGLSTTNGLGTMNGLSTTNGLMTTATTRAMVKYIAKCALLSGTQLVKSDQYGTMYTYVGALGLGPTWLNGSCDAACQQRITSCLLSMGNRDGKHVAIQLVSAASSLTSIGPTGDDVTYPNQEGAFFGNLFPSPPQMYTCAGTEADKAAQVKRHCVGGVGCDLFTKTTPCAQACTQTCKTGPGGKKVCSASSCRSPNGTTWAAPITIFLRNKIEAGNFDATGGTAFGNGVSPMPVTGGTIGIAAVDDEDWIQTNDVQFGAAGSTTTFSATLATVNAGNKIELHLDTLNGPTLATITTTATGSLGIEKVMSAPLASAGIGGKHTVFVKFNGAANRASGLNGAGKQIGNISFLEIK